jgi:hypothetical protein
VPLPKGDPPSSKVDPDRPHMTNYDDPGDGKKLLVASTVVPFLAIEEEEFGADEWKRQGTPFYLRAADTPYYLIERWAYWRQLYYEFYHQPVGRTKEVTVSHGLVSKNATDCGEKTGISVKASLGVDFKGLSASISTELSQQLRLTETSEKEETSTRTEKTTFTYPAGIKFAVASWVHADEFVVKKLNAHGELIDVLSWVTQDSSKRVLDSWPEDVDVKEGGTK